MASLEEFSQISPASLEDFQYSKDEVAPVSNKPSNLNLAAHAAAFVEDPLQVMQAYQTSNAELDMTGKSQAADELLRVAREKSVEKSQVALSNILIDPSVSDADKQATANAALDVSNKVYSTSNMLSREALVADAGHESVETERARISMADAIGEVNAVKKQQQAILNAEIAKKDPNMIQSGVSIINYLMPYSQQLLTGSISDGLLKGDGHAFATALTLLGDSKEDLKETLSKLPPDQRLGLTQSVVDMINQHTGIAMSDDNDFARVDMLRTVLQDGYYESFDKWADNIAGVLDLTLLGGAAVRGAKLAFTGEKVAEEAAENLVRNTQRDAVRSQVQPTTVSQNYKDTNPSKAQSAHEMAASDESGEAAQALYGTNRADAVASDLMPEVASVDGSVRNKVGRPEAINQSANTPDPSVMDFVDHNGAGYYWQSEKRQMRGKVVNDFEQAVGMNARKEMFSVDSLPDGVGVKAVYGPPQGGFGSLEEAVAMAKWSLRDYGVDDSAITVLQRQGSEYVPVSKETPTKGETLYSGRVELQGQEPSVIKTTQPTPEVKPDTGVLEAVKAPEKLATETIGGYEKRIAKLNLPGTEYTLKDGTKVVARKYDNGPDEATTIHLVTKDGKSVGSIEATGGGMKENPNIEVVGEFQRKGAGTLLYDLATDNGLYIGAKNSKNALRTGPGMAIRKAYTPGDSIKFRRPQVKAPETVVQTDIGSKVVVKRKAPDFLVQVESKYKFSPGDVAEWAEADVKYNIFDRVDAFLGTTGAGSLQRHLLDAHSMLHPNITLGANVAVDKAAGLEKELLRVGDNFASGYKAMPKERQGLLESIIKDANSEGTDFNYNKLVTDGVTPKEIQTLKDWRHYWDTVYHLENKDMVKTMRARGFAEFVDEANDTRLFAKPTARTQIAGDVKVYNHVDDTVTVMRADQISELYGKNGTLARLRQPMSVGDDAAEFIVSENAIGKNYLRALTDDSQVLNYRKGYYSVHYKDPQFIVKVVQDSRGNTLYEKAVATAGNIKDADMMVRRMAATDGAKYYRRGDVKKMDMRSDDYWDLQQAGGRSAQKIRGKRLEDATSTVTDPSMTNILGPVDSMIQSARSTSNRVAMRDMLEATKQRFMNQFEEYLPNGKYGQKVLPGNISEVKYRGGQTPNTKKLADARTTFEYIRYLENGYINHIDDGYKATLKTLSDIAGNAGATKLEKGLGWMSEGRGPSAMGKNIAFNMYLATNPFRQFIVQGHQAVQLTANFPRWIASGRAVPQVSILSAFQLGYEPSSILLKGAGMNLEEARTMFRQFERTGQTAAIDKQNLIRGALGDLADTVAGGKTRKFVTAPLTWMRRVGFDAGENVNTMTSWLAHRDQAIREGKDFSKADVQDLVSGQARNYTYNMNAAGDMPYNQNALAAVFQFMQVPHKAMTGMLFNRVMTPWQKARLGGFNALMYTLPPAAMYSFFGDVLPDDPDVRDAVVQGMEGLVLNKLLETATGEESRVDFSGLSPVDMFGTYDFIHSIFTTDVGTVVASTPSGQLFFGNNPRITNFAKTAARYFNLIDDYQDPTTFGQVAHDFASLSSGYSNAFKAAYSLQYGRKLNTMGGITDSNVTRPEGIMQVFGFGGVDEAQKRYVNDATYKKTKAYEDDVKAWYKDFKKHIARQGITPGEVEHTTKVFGEAWRVWGNDDMQARRIIAGELKKDAVGGDDRIYQSVLKATGVMNHAEVKGLIKAAPGYNEEKRKQMNETVDFIYSYKDKKPEDN